MNIHLQFVKLHTDTTTICEAGYIHILLKFVNVSIQTHNIWRYLLKLLQFVKVQAQNYYLWNEVHKTLQNMKPGNQSSTILESGTQTPTICEARQTQTRQFLKTGAQIAKICEGRCPQSRDLWINVPKFLQFLESLCKTRTIFEARRPNYNFCS
jgi:hypothetical protein